MKTAVLDPDDIRLENGMLLASWCVTYRSNSLRSFGEELTRIDRAVIPAEFAGVVEEAKLRGRSLLLHLSPVPGEQVASRVEIL